MGENTKVRPLPMAARKRSDERCPDFDGDCLHIEKPYDCWNNTHGFFDTTVHAPTCRHHRVVAICQCGANRICRTCRSGQGATPCECSPPIEVSYGKDVAP